MIKVVVCDDHELMRNGIAEIIKNQIEGFTVVAEVENGKKLLELINDGLLPDIILMDISMPVMDGYTASRKLNALKCHVPILAFSLFDDKQTIENIIAAGASGFITKSSKTEMLSLALHDMHQKGFHINEYVSVAMLKHIGMHKPISLTKKEMELLPLLCSSKSYQDIAKENYTSFKTIDNHCQHIFKKLDVNNRQALIIKAMQLGLIVK